MSLQHVQSLLARLYTDSSLRDAFFANPLEVGKANGLSEEECLQLQALPIHHTQFFAHSLVHKRQGQVKKHLPSSAQVMGASFDRAFHAFAETYVPKGVRKHKEDSLAFAGFLASWLQDNPPPNASHWPTWLPELIRYEADCIDVMHPSFKWKVALYKYPVRRIARALFEQSDIPDKSKWTSIIWWRSLGRKKLKQWLPLG
jgi:hypothetical protein